MYNAFRIIADLLHAFSFVLILLKLWRTKSSSGISGKSQILYAIVFATRYCDIPFNIGDHKHYLYTLKILFITFTFLNVFLIYGPYKKTYDRDNDVTRNEFLVVPCFMLALFINAQFTALEILWTFSIYLEAVAIIPQLRLLRKINSVDNYVVFYLLSLGMYRAIYILNWVYRYYYEAHYDLIAAFSGIVQTVLFACVFVRIFNMKRREQKLEHNVVV